MSNSRPGSKVWRVLALGWILAAFATAVVLGNQNWIDYYRLARSGVPISAQATGTEPSKHLTLRYRYSVESKVYYGVGHASSMDALQKISIGDTLSISYLADTPHVSCWGDPKRLLVGETLPILVAILFLPTTLMTILYHTICRWSSVSYLGE